MLIYKSKPTPTKTINPKHIDSNKKQNLDMHIILEFLLHVLSCCLFFCSRLVVYLSVYLWWGFVTHSALFSLCPFLVVLFLIFDLVLLHVVFVALVCGCMWAHHSFCLASVCVVRYCFIVFSVLLVFIVCLFAVSCVFFVALVGVFCSCWFRALFSGCLSIV